MIRPVNMTIGYGVLAAVSLLLLAGYLLWTKKRGTKMLLLYSCVALANCGYFWQATTRTLVGAMMANRMSYLGSAYLSLLMLLIIAEVCSVRLSKCTAYILAGISTAVFLLAASGDWLGLYYTSVSIEYLGSMTKLVKVYGPLHPLYAVHLLGYMAAMMGISVYALSKKKINSARHAVLLLVAVLCNLAVWGFGQVVDTDFEFLAISYVVTEVLLLLLDGIVDDYKRLQEQITSRLLTAVPTASELPPNMEELFAAFTQKVATLTSAERRILNYYIDGHETADIPDLAFISIHTVKKHNRNIYEKLGVSSRDELMLYIELFRCCDRLEELTDAETETE